MPQLTLQPHLALEEIKQQMTAQKQLRLHKYWQVIYALAIDPLKESHEIAAVLGTSAANVQRIVKCITLGEPTLTKACNGEAADRPTPS